jgi:hypothetical protein
MNKSKPLGLGVLLTGTPTSRKLGRTDPPEGDACDPDDVTPGYAHHGMWRRHYSDRYLMMP